ncbi:MAG TPA: acetyl-CoA carboxylase biotin carboxyl carrier protein [Pyrinomonadaceae bacterium]|nr:acetyl-CoA carboxylase biotin carboxyl carrier protein [Pyrinomonadaceae bacterium]
MSEHGEEDEKPLADEERLGREGQQQPQRRAGGGHRRGRGGRGGDFSAKERRPEASLNTEELRELFELVAAHGLTDFELEREGFRVRLRRDFAPQISPDAAASVPQLSAQPATAQQAPAASPAAMPEPAPEEELLIITAPIVGTFYRSPSPTADSFVQVGDRVEPTTVVCIIEAMKLMNEIQAEMSGEVAKIFVENNQPVEYGQKLFGIKK